MELEINPEIVTSWDLVVARMLQLAAADTVQQDTGREQEQFRTALETYVQETRPEAVVPAYDYGSGPLDGLWYKVQKAALDYAASSWMNGRETASASFDLDHTADCLEKALTSYTQACAELARETH